MRMKTGEGPYVPPSVDVWNHYGLKGTPKARAGL